MNAQSLLSRFDESFGSGALRALRTPAVFIATNWAALLCAISIIGMVPGLSAASRVTLYRDRYGDEAFTCVLQYAFRTWRRDLPVTALFWFLCLAVLGNGVILSQFIEGSARVFLVGLIAPVGWVAVAAISAYSFSAARLGSRTNRAEVTDATVVLLLKRPFRALVIPAVVLAVSPLWLLAPVTVAVGLSLSPFLVAQVWGQIEDHDSTPA